MSFIVYTKIMVHTKYISICFERINNNRKIYFFSLFFGSLKKKRLLSTKSIHKQLVIYLIYFLNLYL